MSINFALLHLSVPAILQRYRKKTLSPVEVMEACLAQIEKHNPTLNAFAFLDVKAARRAAKASKKRWQQNKPKGVLDGIPVTVKDWFDVKGWPTRYGALMASDDPVETYSPQVARLLEAGAIIIGKTTLPEFGHKGVTHSKATGITRNPYDPRKTSGGSSGGAAVAATTGMGLLHLGSDAGGSIRIPASFSGCFGFKPSPGLVPSYPPSLFSTLSASGPLTRSVADAAIMLDTLIKPDARDWHALPLTPPSFMATLQKPLPKKLRIAYATSINDIKATPEVKRACDQLLPILKKLGSVNIIQLDCPLVIGVFNKHWSAVASHIAGQMPKKIRALLDPRFLLWAARGDALHLHDYLDAERNRMDIGGYFKNILDQYDVLITPTMAMTAFAAGVDMPRQKNGKPWDDWTPFTYPANLAKLPAASLPIALDKQGLPIGLQIMGGYLNDGLVLQVAAALEKKVKFKSWLL